MNELLDRIEEALDVWALWALEPHELLAIKEARDALKELRTLAGASDNDRRTAA